MSTRFVHLPVILPFLLLGLVASPASAGSFSLFAAWTETDEAGEAFGGGLDVAIPLATNLALDLRGSYYEELSDNPFGGLLDDDPIFEENAINIIPVDVGLRYTFNSAGVASPYIGGGGSYYFLDIDRAEINDEVGFYVVVGSSFGDGEGVDFFVEGLYRKATATVENDPDELDELDDIDFADRVDFDLDGFGINAGLFWSF